MHAFIIRRLLQFIPIILVITLIMFILLNILPGNAALMALDERQAADPAYISKLKAELGLDKPVHIRYLHYIKNLAMGGPGHFIHTPREGKHSDHGPVVAHYQAGCCGHGHSFTAGHSLGLSIRSEARQLAGFDVHGDRPSQGFRCLNSGWDCF